MHILGQRHHDRLGVFHNVTSALTSANAPSGAAASATLTVRKPK
jgi:hypothetical protein